MAARFSPYTDNGGTCICIGGKGFAIIASDTRLSTGYQIYTREQSKLFEITPKTILGSTGCWCDVLTFSKVIKTRVKNYSYEHNRTISTAATAQLISNMLYYKRFFPYYISNNLAGLDDNGDGIVYDYDPVGCIEKVRHSAIGTSQALIQPLLDNKLGPACYKGTGFVSLSKEDAITFVKDLFISAGERDIYVGDFVDIRVITESGIENHKFKLRLD